MVLDEPTQRQSVGLVIAMVKFTSHIVRQPEFDEVR